MVRTLATILTEEGEQKIIVFIAIVCTVVSVVVYVQAKNDLNCLSLLFSLVGLNTDMAG
jgi:hypothetical protein